MTKNEPSIAEMNEVIACFSGWEKYGDYYKAPADFKAPYTHYKTISMKFHISWNWLMWVVEKIAALEDNKYNFHISSTGQWACYIDRDDVFDSEIASFGGFDPIIINVYKTVYKFITWYNQQPKTNDTTTTR